METYQNYKGYGIRYTSFLGNTYVEDNVGYIIKIFKGGEIKGVEDAKKWIDKRSL